MDDIIGQLEFLASMAETSTYYSEDGRHRLMPAAGVADVLHAAVAKLQGQGSKVRLDNVVDLPARTNMTVEECLALVSREQGDYESVVVVAGSKAGDVIIRSSNVSRKDALWLAMVAVDNALGR